MTDATVRTDVLISIHPEHIPHIIDRTKDHEFRKYQIPGTVRRMWLYETSPVSALRYCVVVGPARVPGELRVDELSISRNAEFQSGELSEKRLAFYAYKILELHELDSPQSLATLIGQGWAKGAPQRFQYCRSEMLTALELGLKRKF